MKRVKKPMNIEAYDIWLTMILNGVFKVDRSITWSVFFKNFGKVEEIKHKGTIVKVNPITVDVRKEDGSVVRLDQRDLITSQVA
jgi:hypothetical protein